MSACLFVCLCVSQDNVHDVFESILDYARFTVRIAEAEIPRCVHVCVCVLFPLMFMLSPPCLSSCAVALWNLQHSVLSVDTAGLHCAKLLAAHMIICVPHTHRIPDILTSISPAQALAMQHSLARVWHRFRWTSTLTQADITQKALNEYLAQLQDMPKREPQADKVCA